jgi:hypothetical protein
MACDCNVHRYITNPLGTVIDDGHTEPDNLVLLCWFHHHLLHEQHWSIEPLGGGHFNLNDPHGGAQILRPPLVGLALPTDPPTQTELPDLTRARSRRQASRSNRLTRWIP